MSCFKASHMCLEVTITSLPTCPTKKKSLLCIHKKKKKKNVHQSILRSPIDLDKNIPPLISATTQKRSDLFVDHPQMQGAQGGN